MSRRSSARIFRDAYKALGVSRTTLCRWVNEGRVCRPKVLSSRVRIFDTKEFLASLGGLDKPARPAA